MESWIKITVTFVVVLALLMFLLGLIFRHTDVPTVTEELTASGINGNVTLSFGFVETLHNVSNCTGTLLNDDQYVDNTERYEAARENTIQLLDGTNVSDEFRMCPSYTHYDEVATGVTSVIIALFAIVGVVVILIIGVGGQIFNKR